MRKAILAACSMALICAVTTSASAQVYYTTGFEPGEGYTAGQPIGGFDGWVNGSGATANNTVFTVTNAQQWDGVQSLQSSAVSGFESFYSLRRTGLDGWTAASGNPLHVSTRLFIDPITQENRIYGLYLTSTATSTLGGTVQGITIDGAGRVRAGTAWSNTYSNTGLIGTADPGSFLGRWLTIDMTYDPLTGEKTASISGFGGATPSFSWSGFGGSAPAGINIGTDYFADTNRLGVAYFDRVMIGIPEPSMFALIGLMGVGAVSFSRRRKR